MRLRSQSARTLLYEEVVEELYRLIDEKLSSQVASFRRKEN